MQATLREIWMQGCKAKYNGHVWNVEPSITWEGILTREVRVKGYFRSKTGYQASNWRLISIRRPLETMAEIVKE